MTRPQLIKNIIKFITGNFGIPPKLSEGEINERIDDALRFFYRAYDGATQSKWIVVKKEYFGSAEFKETRLIKMPDCVEYVAECKEARTTSLFNMGESGLSISRMVAAEMFLGSYSSDDLTNRLAFISYYDLSKAFLKDWIRHNYNQNTKELHLQGAAPQQNLALRVWVQVEEEKIFDDYLFIDYVRGLCLESMGRMMSVIQMPLVGGATLNADMIRTYGTTMITDVKTKIEEMQPSNYIEFY